MSLETFEQTLTHCGEYVTIGGGEPTLHPQFWQFLGLSLAECGDAWLATNGSQTKTALALAKMAKQGIIGCELSLDPFHDEIDSEVEQAFMETENERRRNPYGQSKDRRAVRDTSANLIKAGRCEDGKEDCLCPEYHVRPNGDIHQCGCLDSPKIGDVWNGFKPLDEVLGQCYKEIKEYKRLEAEAEKEEKAA